MIICPTCDTENVSDAKFCRQCGRAVGPGLAPGAVVSWLALIYGAVLFIVSAVFSIATVGQVVALWNLRAPLIPAGIAGGALVSFSVLRAGIGGHSSPSRRTAASFCLVVLGMLTALLAW